MGTTVQEVVAKFTGDDSDLQKTAASATAAVAKYATAGIGVAIGALGIMTKNSMNAIDATGDLAKSVSISTDKFKNMALVFEESGSSAEGMISSLSIMQRNLADAASGGEATSAAFKTLGLNINDLINMTPDEQFTKIATAISTIENPTQRAGVAMDIFGRGALKMTDIFVDFAAKANEAEAFQRKFNLALSDIDTAVVAEANDAMGRVGMTINGVGNTIAVQVSPLITAFSQSLLDAAMDGETFGKGVAAGVGIAADAIDIIRRAVLGFRLTFNGMIAGILEGVASAKEALGMDGGLVRAMAEEAKSDVRSVTEEIQNFESTADRINKITAETYERARKQVAQGKGAKGFDPKLNTEKDDKASAKKLKDELSEQEKALKKLQDEYDNLGKAASDNFYDMLTGAQSFSDGFKGIMNSILKSVYDATVGKSLSNTISNLLGSTGILGNATGGGSGSAASGIFSSIGSSISNMFKFADGGVVQGATTFPIGSNVGMMGEAGAEAIMPLTRKGGKLGVANYGGGGANVTQNINISTGVSQTVRAELTRMMPEIRNQSVKAWEDANKRNRIG